jgi:NAD-dependent dihydropyrimidine dehydrogenase PreA subunit
MNIKVDTERCSGCGICVQDCPVNALRLKKKKAVIGDGCTLCSACVRNCPEGALSVEGMPSSDSVQCGACPIFCWIKEGYPGACQRYRNHGGKLIRIETIHPFDEVEQIVGPELPAFIQRPLITGMGAGTTYPDFRPAPCIVKANREGVDVVTVVTEAPLSYSSILVKIDTDLQVGDEGAAVLKGKRKVGMVTTEQYGSKMLSIGGVNLLTGKDGLLVARMIADVANKKAVKLNIRGGSRLELQVGQAPIIDGIRVEKMRVGCGSAALGLFAPRLKDSADEVIILDSHLTGLLSEHAAGRFVGARSSGVKLRFRQSTPGRYFGDRGKGWGGTSITNPTDVIAKIDPEVAWVGMRILITETTGQRARLFELRQDGHLYEIPISGPAVEAVNVISSSCESSRVSGIYIGGAGGSARAGVARHPLGLTNAIHERRAALTIGGAPTFILPGGGINFMVDVERIKAGSFYWTPTPATICPIEYTMELQDYREMGGHLEAMRPFSSKEPVTICD